MRVYILWEHYKGIKWIKNIYLSRSSAQAFVNRWKDHNLQIEEHEVIG